MQHDKEKHGTSLLIDAFGKANLPADEYVALMGIHTLGFVGMEKKGPHTRWCMNPYVFDNTYYKELMLGERSKYYKTDADRRLTSEPQFREWVEKYAED